MDVREHKDNNIIGKLTESEAYSMTEAVRGGLNISSMGLGLTKQITRKNSFISVVTIESFCAVMGLVILTHEIIDCCKNRGFNTKRSLYICFRLFTILASVAGVGFIVDDMQDDSSLKDMQTTIGTVLIGIGIFGSRMLSMPKKQEQTQVNSLEEPFIHNQPGHL